jgi:D-alanine-D-alanine ligase
MSAPPTPLSLGKVAVMMGGISGEREISLDSGNNVLESLRRSGVNAFAFDPKQSSLGELIRAKPDRVFMILHGQPGEDGRYQALLDLHRIPYTGTGMLGSALALDKRLSKQAWLNLGIATPRFRVIPHSFDERDFDAVRLELHATEENAAVVIKPSCEGSSLGITIARTQQDWQEGLISARRYRGEVLAEEFIAGLEYTVGVVGNIALPTVAIRYQTAFYDFHAKYTDEKTQLICPCDLPSSLQNHLQSLAINAAKPLQVRGWYRADFIVSHAGQPYLLEINTAPGMTSHSLVPKAAQEYGWSYDRLVLEIAALAMFDPVV